MWTGALIGIALLAVLIMGFGFASGLLLFAVPVAVVVLLIGVGTLVVGRNALRKQTQISRLKRFRGQAMARKNEFDATDKQTLV